MSVALPKAALVDYNPEKETLSTQSIQDILRSNTSSYSLSTLSRKEPLQAMDKPRLTLNASRRCFCNTGELF